MNPTIDLLMAHRSIRKFTEKPIDDALLEILVNAGQASASSSFLQGVTIIRITDPIKRQQFVTLANNQSSIAAAPEFLVFCADLSRSIRCCKMHGGMPTEGFTEQFIICVKFLKKFSFFFLNFEKLINLTINFFFRLKYKFDPMKLFLPIIRTLII